MSEDTGNGNAMGDAVAAVIVTTPTTSSNAYLVRGYIALGISFVATAFAAKYLTEAKRAAILEAGDAVLTAGKLVANQ